MESQLFVIRYYASVKKELRDIPQSIRARVIQKIQALAHDPYPVGVVKLSGALQLYRIRSGDYRIIYEINGSELLIVIVKIGHRREVYRQL